MKSVVKERRFAHRGYVHSLVIGLDDDPATINNAPLSFVKIECNAPTNSSGREKLRIGKKGSRPRDDAMEMTWCLMRALQRSHHFLPLPIYP